MNLVIDEGNSFIKAGVFQDGNLMKTFKGSIDQFQKFIEEHTFQLKLLCSVKKSSSVLDVISDCVEFNYHTSLPFSIDYTTPQTLGMDRIAAIVGSSVIKPNENNLVIDIGTCITYDLLIDNTFKGGIISPGVKLRNTSMHNYTSALPLVSHELQKHPDLVGRNTEGALLSGIFNGISAEINGMIDTMKASFSIKNIFITGGDAIFFESKIKAPIFVDPELVLKGLNKILLYTNDL